MAEDMVQEEWGMRAAMIFSNVVFAVVVFFMVWAFLFFARG